MLRRAGLVQKHHLKHSHILGACLPRVLYTALPCRRSNLTAASAKSLKSRHPKPVQTSALPSLPTLTNLACEELVEQIRHLLSLTLNNVAAAKSIEASPDLLQRLTHNESVRRIAEALASSHTPLQSIRLISVAHAVGCRMKFNVYEVISFCLAKTKHWNGILSAVSLAEQHQGRLSSRLINWRTRALVEVEDYAAIEGTLDEFRKQNLVPNRRTFHLILSAHIRNRSLSLAKQCLVAMRDTGCPPDASTHAIVATHYRRLGRDPHVEAQSLEALSDVKATTATAVLNSLIMLRLDVYDLPGALRLLTMFNRSYIVTVLAIMLEGMSLEQRTIYYGLDSSHPLWQKLIPSAATYSMLMDYQTAHRNHSAVLDIFKGMLDVGIEPTTDTVASLIHAFYAAGQGIVAIHMVAKMCSAKGVNVSMFDPIMPAQDFGDFHWTPSDRLLTIRVFNALLKGILPTNGVEGMETILHIMQASSVRPTSRTLEILMTHLNKAERCQPGVLLRILRQFSSSSIQPTLRHLHTVFSCVLHHEKDLLYGTGWDIIAARYSSRRVATERRYPERRISVRTDSFDPTAGLELPRAPGHRRLGRPSIESLRSRKVLSDSAMMSLRIRHDALIKSDLDSAKEIFDILVDRGMRPNEYHFSALMEGLARSGDVDGALDIMKSAVRVGIQPNIVMFTILIVGHAHMGKPDKAIKIFQEMVASGITPDVPSIDAVISAFFVVGAYSMAKKILRTMWSYVQPFPDELREAPLKTLAQAFRYLHDKNRGGVKPPSKEQRLKLHLKLVRLREVWEEVSTMLPTASMRRKAGSRLLKYKLIRRHLQK